MVEIKATKTKKAKQLTDVEFALSLKKQVIQLGMVPPRVDPEESAAVYALALTEMIEDHEQDELFERLAAADDPKEVAEQERTRHLNAAVISLRSAVDSLRAAHAHADGFIDAENIQCAVDEAESASKIASEEAGTLDQLLDELEAKSGWPPRR